MLVTNLLHPSPPKQRSETHLSLAPSKNSCNTTHLPHQAHQRR